MTQLDQNPFRIYHPRNISEFKVGDLIMRVEPVTFFMDCKEWYSFY